MPIREHQLHNPTKKALMSLTSVEIFPRGRKYIILTPRNRGRSGTVFLPSTVYERNERSTVNGGLRIKDILLYSTTIVNVFGVHIHEKNKRTNISPLPNGKGLFLFYGGIVGVWLMSAGKMIGEWGGKLSPNPPAAQDILSHLSSVLLLA